MVSPWSVVIAASVAQGGVDFHMRLGKLYMVKRICNPPFP